MTSSRSVKPTAHQAETHLTQFQRLIDSEQKSIPATADVKKVGYICNYTPVEILDAGGVRNVRLLKAGSPRTVSSGERYTQSVFCDFTKSCIGFFEEGDPLHGSLDKVYNFHTCATMKRASEVIEQFVPTRLLNLPKLRTSEDARAFFREEIVNFRDDVGDLVGAKIADDKVREHIVLRNRARRLLKQISELRRRPIPPITGKEYLDLVRGYYYLPPERLVDELESLYQKLEAAPARGERPLRIMVSGSIMAESDRRLLDIVEGELGARVVIEDHCAGVRPFYHTIAEDGDPYRALADGYLDQAPCARMKPIDDSIAFSSRLAKEYAVDGVIYVYLKFCACYGVTKKEFVSAFQAQRLPTLEISSDYSESDYGQLKTRVEAFIDVLRERLQHRDDAVAFHE